MNLESTDKAVAKYYRGIEEEYEIYFKTHQAGYPPESAVEPHFISLLNYCSRKVNWKFVSKRSLPNGNIPDGTFLEPTSGILSMGYMEAKDDDDDLDDEIKTKLNDKLYPAFNILFWQPKRIVLIQNKKIVRDEIIAEKPENLVSILNDFFNYEHFDSRSWAEAIKTFDEQMPLLARGLLEKIEESEKKNKPFIVEFDKFYHLCRSSINPNIGKIAIKEMVVQHLLTERILRSIFDLDRFVVENAIAGQLDRVISSMTSKYFNRTQFLGTLDHFYDQIIQAADKLEDFKTKQVFLNDIFERFFQGWAIKAADRLGIVYTPQPVVDFMVRSVDELLKTEFGKKHGLGSEKVHIIDPFVGTGNFIVNVINKISPTKLEHKYKHELHCNEIQLMPYYIANMNIEHAYFEAMGEKTQFPGICFADTFQMSEEFEGLFFNEENAKRVIKQSKSPIFVVISNPPYNTNQANEMDNNKNRVYSNLEQEIKDTYSKSSKATLKNKLMDPYVKAIKWATSRIGKEGIVAMITNNSFLDAFAFDGMRKHLGMDFNKVITLNLGGNIRKCEGGNTNIFGIRVGVAITFFIKNNKISPPQPSPQRGEGVGAGPIPPQISSTSSPPPSQGGGVRGGGCEVLYYDMKTPTADEKKKWLEEHKHTDLEFQIITPNKNHLWLTEGMAEDFEDHPLMGDKHQKGKADCDTIFSLFSNGVKTNRDSWVYNFSKDKLTDNMKLLIGTYNSEVERWKNTGTGEISDIDDFVTYDEKTIKWDGTLKNDLMKENKGKFAITKIRISQYRPFSKKKLYYCGMFNNSIYLQYKFFPTPESEKENRVIWTKVGMAWPMFGLMVNHIPDLMPQGGSQNFPFYTYGVDGTGRKENITDKTLKMYQEHYKNNSPPQPSPQRVEGVSDGSTPPETSSPPPSQEDGAGSIPSSPPPSQGGGVRGGGSSSITKWDIFYYIYAMLHHPSYREDFKDNLKRSLPRIPFAPDFWQFANTGKKLADLHLNYETADIYELDELVDKDIFPRAKFRVTKMKLSKDKKELVYNDAITFTNIPEKVYEYKLGNRSALEWIVDQYKVKTDKRSGITQDPNNFDGNEKYIYELVGRVVTVSLETMKFVSKLSELDYK